MVSEFVGGAILVILLSEREETKGIPKLRSCEGTLSGSQ